MRPPSKDEVRRGLEAVVETWEKVQTARGWHLQALHAIRSVPLPQVVEWAGHKYVVGAYGGPGVITVTPVPDVV